MYIVNKKKCYFELNDYKNNQIGLKDYYEIRRDNSNS